MSTLPQREQEYAQANQQLQATGWFTEVRGPFNQWPVELLGTLRNGAAVHFRAREQKIELWVTQGDREVRHFIEPRPGQDTGSLDGATCFALVRKWVAEYLIRG